MTITEKISVMLKDATAKKQKQEKMLLQHTAGIAELAADTPDMILSAMPAKLQNLQDSMTYLETLQREVEVLEELLNAEV